MLPLESRFFFKFLHYFLLIYFSFLFLYWLIDSFEKSLRITHGGALFFSPYALSTILVIAVQQVNNALLYAACFWLYEYARLHELESTLVVNLSLLRLVRPLFLFIFITQGLLFYLNEAKVPYLIALHDAYKEALLFKKPRLGTKWTYLSDQCFVRESSGEIDSICKMSRKGKGDIAFFKSEGVWQLSEKGSFFKDEVGDVFLFDLLVNKKTINNRLQLKQKISDRKNFFYRSLQVYSLFIWFWYSVVFAINFWWIFIFWHLIYYLSSFLGIFLAHRFLWYALIYVPLWLWILGLCFLLKRLHRG